MTTFVDADSVLAIDVGSVNTRAALFDVVEGSYRFLAAGSAPTSAYAPYKDVLEGVTLALHRLEEVTGRKLLDSDTHQLIIPAMTDGAGIDRCVVTLSAGAPLRVVLVGLLEDVSLQSAQHLAETTYAQVLDAVGLNDRRSATARLDTILRLRPDMVIIAGGFEDGAAQSVLSLLEAVGLACYLTPKEQMPEVLFCGNQALNEQVKQEFSALGTLHFAPNIRPSLESEELLPAQKFLTEAFRQARSRQIGGVNQLDHWSGGTLQPGAAAFARTIRYLSQESAHKQRGVLGVDLGASATTLAAGFMGQQSLHVQSRLGLGANLAALLRVSNLDEISRWLEVDLPQEYLRDYIYNKSLYPASLPLTAEDLALEYALATQILYLAAGRAAWNLPANLLGYLPGYLPPFETIIAAGGVFTNAPSAGRVLLTLLNGLQPVGWSSMVLDQNNLAGLLGAAAEIIPLLTVQGLRDSTSFANLALVVAPVGHASPGSPVLRVEMKTSSGSESVTEVKYGALEVIRLPVGQTAEVRLQPLHRFDIGMGQPGRGGTIKNVAGSELGLVIDARGRPLELPKSPHARQEAFSRWLAAMEG